MKGRVLSIAGSDSGGGAGIQADIKAITCLGGFAMTALTALTAQNTLGVHGVEPVPNAFVRQQIDVVLRDIGADCLKIGMLGTASIIATVSQALVDFAQGIPLVLDPVMVAKGGHSLLDDDAVAALRGFVPRAALLTPNLPEAGVLLGRTLETEADMMAAVEPLRALGAGAVLLKGGHLAGDALLDLLITRDEVVAFRGERFASRHTHGTGCTLSSAIATGLAQGMTLVDAVARGRDYVRQAILTAPGLGGGHGPLNHGWVLGANL
jgi:hydroxymethylpyrimidine/phosphomethylpyrimidine kinase